MYDLNLLKKKSKQIRQRVLDMCVKAGTGHVNSSFSCTEILVALYYGGFLRHDPKNPDSPDRDRFILSKGQASPILYTILSDLGYFSAKELDLFAQAEGMFGVHLQHDVPGVEITSGSLGIGFGVAVGLALGEKMNRNLPMIYTVMGDGECYEGSIWESAMFAAHHKLNNLVAIIDRNHLCATDFTENIVALEPMAEKWAAFGWNVRRIDGHSFEALHHALEDLRSRPFPRPTVIIADTVKGKGISFMSNAPLWHGMAPNGDMAVKAKKELASED